MDLAEYLGYSRASITYMVNELVAKGFLKEGKGNLELTEEGILLSRQILERYMFFFHLLTKCGVTQTTAEKEACKMEHILSPESFELLRKTLGGV